METKRNATIKTSFSKNFKGSDISLILCTIHTPIICLGLEIGQSNPTPFISSVYDLLALGVPPISRPGYYKTVANHHSANPKHGAFSCFLIEFSDLNPDW